MTVATTVSTSVVPVSGVTASADTLSTQLSKPSSLGKKRGVQVHYSEVREEAEGRELE